MSLCGLFPKLPVDQNAHHAIQSVANILDLLFEIDPRLKPHSSKLSSHDFFDPEVEEQYLPDGVTILTGESGSGKSSFATALAIAHAMKEPFANVQTLFGREVVWFAGEEDYWDRTCILRHRFENDTLHEGVPFTTHYGPFPLDNEANLDRFLDLVCNASLVVLDPLPSFVTNQSAYRDLVLALRLIGPQYGPSFLLLHWNNGSHIIGGPGVRSAANAVWYLSHTKAKDGRIVELDQTGRAYPTPRKLTFVSVNPMHYEVLQTSDLAANVTMEQRVAAALSDKPTTAEALAADLKLNLGSIRNTLLRLKERGLATTAEKSGRKTTYVVASLSQ